MKKIIIICIMLFAAFPTASYGKIIREVNFKQKKYFADLVVSENKALLWFRINKNSSSQDDIQILELHISNLKYEEAIKRFCESKNILDQGKTIVGCLSIVGSTACAMASAATDGATTAFCLATWKYTQSQGLSDCILGISDLIADALGQDDKWRTTRIIAELENKQYKRAIELTIDSLCKLK